MSENEKQPDFKVKVSRFNPDVDKNPSLQSFTVPYEMGLSVLNVLQYIYDNLDPSLGFYYSCRIGKCKGCNMMVNGKITMVCTSPASSEMTIEPLTGYEVIKDLVIDQSKGREK
ncbi:MAG: 2Fe-2S iron-sulfur cluster-binding protein [Candidatus Ranarchaeia archaeon]|jgi:succinate dehydrogenase/fumarate reductase iron-sulfur protein